MRDRFMMRAFELLILRTYSVEEMAELRKIENEYGE